MNITLIGTYSPRKCGIATFSENLCSAMELNGGSAKKTAVNIIAVNDNANNYLYSPKVSFTIKQELLHDYISAADFINNSNTDVCIVQHEYGIYGGESGIYILTFLHHLRVPVIVTAHTVLKNPSYIQKLIMQEIAKTAYKIAVMSKTAVDFLHRIYQIPSDKIIVIEHGVPETRGDAKGIKDELAALGKRKMLFTFGLLSKNKGIETVIKALPAIAAKHPEVLYIVAGNTHPAVLRDAGETYREYLQTLAERLGVENHIHFINRFLSDEELFTFLKHIDIYITPYLNEDQITSGTLSYAIGAGAACISTPYWHAKELLDNGRGKIFPFKDANALSEQVNELLDDSNKLQLIQRNANQYAAYVKWPYIGVRYLKLAEETLTGRYRPNEKENAVFDINNMPDFSLAHIQRLTDTTGIIQHATYCVPNFKEGYCLDDNARALIMTLMSYEQFHSQEPLDLLPKYLSFISYMQREDGWFRNFLHYDRSYLDEVGSEDSFGRTIWALAYLINHAPNNSYREFASLLFLKSYPIFTQLKHLRGIANTVIGISWYLKSNPGDEGMTQVLQQLTERLTNALDENSSDEWIWFEDKLTYDNGILPLSLLHSYEITGDKKVKQSALETIAFLKTKTLFNGYLMPVGNDGWCVKENPVITLFDQQAIDTMAKVLLFEKAYLVTNDTEFLNDMNTCFEWFTGKNALHIPLYDDETHGCADGLQRRGINRNQGAESTLAYLISYLTVLKTNASLKRKRESLFPFTKEYQKSKALIKI